MALALGDNTAKQAGRLTLNPLPHIDPLGSIILPFFMSLLPGGVIFGWAKPIPYNPYNLRAGKWGPALVALAGPVSNLILATVFGLGVRFSSIFSISSVEVLGLMQTIVLMNIVLAIFNLIPIPPLDGSKILFAILPYRLRWIEEWMGRYQLVLLLVVVFFLAELLSPIMLWLFSWLTGVGI
ncbi:MAG: site-2 protease family protein [Patescibacteria group bacterium]